MREKISLATARRIALAAQGFADPRPSGPIDRRHLNRVLARIGLLQIDSVSAVVRAHYMPLFSRLGPYPMALLDDAASGRRRRLFEYWAHEASFLPVETYPLMRWRMERAAHNEEIYGRPGSVRARANRPDRGHLPGSRCARPDRSLGHRRRKGFRRLVGLERRKARLRMAVLGGPHHHPFASRFRTPLRSARARAAGRHLQCARPGSRRRPPRTPAHFGARTWRRHVDATCATISGSRRPI